MNNGPFSQYFNQRDFIRTTRKLSGRLLESALLLWFVLADEKTPASVRLAVIAGLGYLIAPCDAIFDYLPFGFGDDLAVLTALVLSLEGWIGEDHRERARNWRVPPTPPPEE